MKTITTLIFGVGLSALQGCATDPTVASEEAVATGESAVSAGDASITITSDTGTKYCALVTITNTLNQTTARWQVILDLKSTTVTSAQRARFKANTGVAAVVPLNNTSVAPGATATFAFCANAPNANVRPAIKAWNMESDAYATCPSNSGLNPTKAALAVAMANELGRWDALTDLTVDSSGAAALSETGLARCTNGCPNTKALLGQQAQALIGYVDQTVFNPTVLRTDLYAAFGRQRDLIDDLTRNNPAALPPAHRLTFVGGPSNLGIGGCGPHYIFQVDRADGTALSSGEAAAMTSALCFFGQGGCGGNPYVGLVQVTAGCPAGRTCLAIDPTDGDNSTTSTTTSGSAPTYPLNRVWDPTNSLLGTQCITSVTGRLGALVSMCSLVPATCGYLYCN
jgi:hypothetical protein